jgi:long-chain acyl-CoA synthetase
VITRRLMELAALLPDEPAVIDEDRTLTYSSLLQLSSHFADYLSERMHVHEGDICAISMPNCWKYPVAFFAAARIGAVFLPLNPQWRPNEFSWIAGRLGVRIAIACAATLPVWDEVDGGSFRQHIVNLDEPELAPLWERAPQSPAPPSNSPYEAQPVLYLTTSGSTGRPKIVPRSHLNLIAGRTAVAEALGTQPGHRFLSIVPFHHANGFANCMFLPLASGAVSVIQRKPLPAAIVASIHRERVRTLIGSPVLFSLLADHGPQPEDLSTVQHYISSGAPLPLDLAARWRERYGRPIHQLYGSSETGTISIEQEGGSPPGCVGRPVRGVFVRILDSAGAPAEPGSSGEIAVKGPAMMSGYVGDDALNQQVLVDGYFRMGDTGRINQDGLLWIDGRSKRWINSGGVKVDPVEVEQALLQLPAVMHCRVHPATDSRGFETISCRITLRPGHTCSRPDIIAHCRRHLAEYKIPRVIEFVLPTATDLTGKIRMESSSI